MKVHESSWMSTISKFRECSCFLKISWLNEANYSYHCDGLLTWAHGLTLYLATSAFLGAATPQVFRHTRNCCRRDGLLRARDPNAFALPRIAERSHRPAFIVYHTSSSCNFAFKQRVHGQICLSGFRGHDFMERSVVTLETPSVKRKSPRKNSPPQQRIVETRTIEISWFY